MTTSFQIRVSGVVGPQERELIWEEFYASRGRGTSLNVHAPWLDSDPTLRCVSAWDGRLVIGCAILRLRIMEPDPIVGMIGFVCVRQEFRGQGVARQILSALILEAKALQLRGLMLWTRSPAIYLRFGFKPDTSELLLKFPKIQNCSAKPETFVTYLKKTVVMSNPLGLRGLPAFAHSATLFESGATSALVLKTTIGPALAEWKGEDLAVAELLSLVLLESWWLNALTTDTLPSCIQSLVGAPLEQQQSTRLVLSLHSDFSQITQSIRVMDRI